MFELMTTKKTYEGFATSYNIGISLEIRNDFKRNIIELLYIGYGKRYSAEHSNYLVTHVMCPILNKNYHVRYQLSLKLEMLEFQITYDGLLMALILLLLDIVVMQ